MNALILVALLFSLITRRLHSRYERPLESMLRNVTKDSDLLLLQTALPSLAKPIRESHPPLVAKSFWQRLRRRANASALVNVWSATPETITGWQEAYQAAFRSMVNSGCPKAGMRLSYLRNCLDCEQQAESERLAHLDEYVSRVKIILLLSAVMHAMLARSWLVFGSDVLMHGLALCVFCGVFGGLSRYLPASEFCRSLGPRWMQACLADEQAFLGVSSEYDRYLENAVRIGSWSEDLRLQLLARSLYEARELARRRQQRLKHWVPILDLLVALLGLPLMNIRILADSFSVIG